MITTEPVPVTRSHVAQLDSRYGYCTFAIGDFRFQRDEYFARITYPKEIGRAHV